MSQKLITQARKGIPISINPVKYALSLNLSISYFGISRTVIGNLSIHSKTRYKNEETIFQLAAFKRIYN